MRENSPVMKFIQNFPYVVCVLMALRILTFYEAFKMFLWNHLYPESHYRKMLLYVGKKGAGYFLNVEDVGYECAEMEFLDINLTKD